MPSKSSSEKRLAERSGKERKGRETLFAGHGSGSTKRSKRNNTTASEAQSIQKSLLRTQSLLKNELHRVSQVQSAIDEDGKILSETMDHHKSLNTKNAQKALTSLQRAQQHEQRVLMASMVFFFLVAFNILWSRVLAKFDFISPILSWTGMTEEL